MTDQTTTVEPAKTDYLLRGSDYLAARPNFKLVGRDAELESIAKILTRHKSSSILLTGPGGVGCSTIAIGLQASKDSPNASVDVIGKRMFWLDTDGLFSSGNATEINEAFQRTIKTLSQSPDTILIVDDMRDFVDAANSNGCTNLINVLMREIKQKKFQAILETDDDDIETVLKAHSDMKESFTILDVQQPDDASLRLIMREAAKRLTDHHKIKISEDAIDTAIEMTAYRVRDLGLSRAQPERSVNLLDRALTSYRLQAHSRDPRLDELEKNLAAVTAALTDPNYSQDQGGKSREELEQSRAALESDIKEVMDSWAERQKLVKKVYRDMRASEEEIRKLEDAIAVQKQQEAEIRAQREAEEDEAPAKAGSKEIMSGFSSDAVSKLEDKIKLYRGLARESRAEFDRMTADINSTLELRREHVLSEFSTISGIPVNKLTMDEKAKLRNLEHNLGNRVWGQQNAVTKLADEVLIAKSGLQDPNKPEGAFLYLGPSGVGKTELAKALAAELMDDEKAILRFDMSEYMEKHAVAKLIGAPPGYEGYEAGGILTNEMRRNPRRIILLDEIEKAHQDILLILLQVLDDARLTDNRGLTVSFKDAFIVMTSNTGKEYFVDPNLTFEEAQEKAIADLEKLLPPELLNRLNGRQNIVCFDKLDLDVIEKIATRELGKLAKQVVKGNPDLRIEIDPAHIRAMCEDHYNPVQGARGIVGYIKSTIKPAIAKTLLFEDGAKGVMKIEYDAEAKKVTVNPPHDDTAARAAAPALKAGTAREFSGAAGPT